MKQVKLSSILETIKPDNDNWNFLIECLKSNYDGVINTEELILTLFPLKNRKLLFLKLDNAKYTIFDVDSLEIYNKDKITKLFDGKLFNLLFHDSTPKEKILNELEIIEFSKNTLKTIFESYVHKDGISSPTIFEFPVNDELIIRINVATGLIYFISKSRIEISNLDLSPISSNVDLIEDYEIKTCFIPKYIQDRKEDFNPDYSVKYGYKH